LFVLPPIYLRAAPRRPVDGDAVVAPDPLLVTEPATVGTVGGVRSWPAPPAATTSEG
jgi:hypothetical protein